MSVARSRIGWQVASAVALTVVVVWTIAPTYPMTWMAALGQEGPTTYHSWFSPMPFGYGAFHAGITGALAIVAAIGAWYGVAVKRARRVPAWWALAGAVILVGWSAYLGHFTWSHGVALAGLVLGAGAALMAARPALPTVVSEPAAR